MRSNPAIHTQDSEHPLPGVQFGVFADIVKGIALSNVKSFVRRHRGMPTSLYFVFVFLFVSILPVALCATDRWVRPVYFSSTSKTNSMISTTTAAASSATTFPTTTTNAFDWLAIDQCPELDDLPEIESDPVADNDAHDNSYFSIDLASMHLATEMIDGLLDSNDDARALERMVEVDTHLAATTKAKAVEFFSNLPDVAPRFYFYFYLVKMFAVLGAIAATCRPKHGSTAWTLLSVSSALALLVTPSHAACDGFMVGCAQRPTTECGVGPFGCHVSTTVSTLLTTATPALAATTNASTTVIRCRYPAIDRHPMAFAIGTGFARPGVVIRLPASAATSSFVPPPPETDFIQVFRPHFGADWEENYDDESDQEEESDLANDLESHPTDNSSAPAARLLSLPAPTEQDRIVDYGVVCPTTLAPVNTASDDDGYLATEYQDADADDTEDVLEDDVRPRRPQTAHQRVGSVRRLLYPRLQTSALTPIHTSSMVSIEPATAPVPCPFYFDMCFPAAVRAHHLLRTPPPPAPHISDIEGVQAATDPIDLFPVRFQNRQWLDELLPETVHVIKQCYFRHRPKRVPWARENIWEVRRVLPARFHKSVSTRAEKIPPLPAPLATNIADLPAPVLFIAPPLPPLPVTTPSAPRVRVTWPLSVSGVDMLRFMGFYKPSKSVPADSGFSNASHPIGECDLMDAEDNVSSRSSIDDHAASFADAPLASTPTPTSTPLAVTTTSVPLAPTSTPTSTSTNFAIAILAVLLVAQLSLLVQLRRDRDAWRTSARALHRDAVFRALKVGQERHRAVRSRVARVHRRLRAAPATVKVDPSPPNSASLLLDVFPAPTSRRAAVRRIRPRSARCSAVELLGLAKRTSVARPLSARETARKSTVQHQCYGAALCAPKAAAWELSL